MTLKLKNIKIDYKKVGFFRFRKMGKDYLLTNDFGSFIVLTLSDFRSFLEGKLDYGTEIYKKLYEKGFLKNIDSSTETRLIHLYQRRNDVLFNSGPSLHIIAVTLRCNQKCVYCHANSRSLKETGYDMTLDIAKQTVDFIFKTPSSFIGIEFQGGEPLVNWPTLKFIVSYAREKSKKENRKLGIALVSNLTLMNDEKLGFLIENEVTICTSLDGPEKVHNKNRLWVKGNNYKSVTRWIKKIKEKMLETKPNYVMGALPTITRHSLSYPKEIIDEYLKWGITNIHLRPLTNLGVAKISGEKISYSAKEFIDFWVAGMDYIISMNKAGTFLQERQSSIMLQKILTEKCSHYTDLRSPCGAVLGQILYNYDGDIYTCDEGRMLEDDTFLIGNVKKDYKNVILNNKTKTMLMGSCLENSTCDYCAYKNYCGVCPVRNYACYGNLFPQIQNTDWCKIHMGQLDYIFKKLSNKNVRKIFQKWIPAN